MCEWPFTSPPPKAGQMKIEIGIGKEVSRFKHRMKKKVKEGKTALERDMT